MAGDLEAGRGQRLKASETTGQLEHFATAFAVEMMVVGLSGKFVAGGFSGQFDRREPALLDERLDVAVYGGNADALLLGGGKL